MYESELNSIVESSESVPSEVLKRLAAISVVMAVGMALVAEPLIQIVYGPRFLPSVHPFWILLPGLLLLTFEQVISSYYAASGLPWRIARPAATSSPCCE